jgi:alpha-amylase/alpha-mannosidase (GH57 family)
MVFCSVCDKQLVIVYDPVEPLKVKEYVCFECGKSFDSSIKNIYKDRRINFKFAVQKVLELCWDVRSYLRSFGVHLPAEKSQYLNKVVKNVLNSNYLSDKNKKQL